MSNISGKNDKDIPHYFHLTHDNFDKGLESIVTKYGLDVLKMSSSTLRHKYLF